MMTCTNYTAITCACIGETPMAASCKSGSRIAAAGSALGEASTCLIVDHAEIAP